MQFANNRWQVKPDVCILSEIDRAKGILRDWPRRDDHRGPAPVILTEAIACHSIGANCAALDGHGVPSLLEFRRDVLIIEAENDDIAFIDFARWEMRIRFSS